MPRIDVAVRLERVRRAMRSEGVDTLLLSVGDDLPYLTGYRAMPLERLTMLVVRPSGVPVLVVPELEAPRVQPDGYEVRPWSETEDPVAIVASLAGRPSVVGIGDETWARFLLDLFAHMTETTFIPASNVVSAVRLRKDESEIEALRAAAASVDRVVERITSLQMKGRTEAAVARDVASLTVEEGHDEATFWIVAAGENSASPHHEPGSRVIGGDEPVLIDFGGRLDGYCSDTTRMFHTGTPTPQQEKLRAIVEEAQLAAQELARPGVPASAVDRAARSVIDAAGYGEHFIHRTGHGIGMSVHEAPYLVAGNEVELEPGMAFSIEPGIYLPGEGGVRLENICVVTNDGIEILNRSGLGYHTVG